MTFELENWWFHRVILCLMETLTGLSTEPCSTPWLCERKRSNRTRTDKSKRDVDVFLQRRSCAATPSTDHYCTHTVTRRICNSWSDAGMFYLSGRFIKDLHKCSCSENRRLQINIWTGSALVHSLMSVYVCVGGEGGGCLGQCYWDWSQTVYCLEFDGVWLCFICICLCDTLWMKPSINHGDKNNRNWSISCIGMNSAAAEEWACTSFVWFHYLFPSRPTRSHIKNQPQSQTFDQIFTQKNVCIRVFLFFNQC